MTHNHVERILREDPSLVKEIALSDGRRYRVKERERWLAGPVLVLLDRGDLVHIAYHIITSIRILSNGGRR